MQIQNVTSHEPASGHVYMRAFSNCCVGSFLVQCEYDDSLVFNSLFSYSLFASSSSCYQFFFFHSVQSRGQFRFCNSIPVPIPIKAIPIQFRLWEQIPLREFNSNSDQWQFHSNSNSNTATGYAHGSYLATG